MNLDDLKSKVIINNEIDQKNFDYLTTQVDQIAIEYAISCLLYTSPSPRD